jgi:Protein of unknown function (DUF2846)
MRSDTGIASDCRWHPGVCIGAARHVLYAAVVLGMTLMAIPARAQNSLAPGCGPDDEQFNVKTDKNYHPEATIDPGKAAVYFIQDDREFQSIPKPTVRMGIDGKWMGATHGTSYLFAEVDPGEHHLCAMWQSVPGIGFGVGKQFGALHFTAEAGKAYFFQARDRWYRNIGSQPMKFEPLDSDQGKLLIAQWAHSVSQPKK